MKSRRCWPIALSAANAAGAMVVLALGSLAFGHAYSATVAMLCQQSPSLLEDHAAYEDARLGVLHVLSGTSNAAWVAALLLGLDAIALLLLAWRTADRPDPDGAVPSPPEGGSQ